MKNLEDIEKKYPGISEKDGWVDLHFERGQGKINDDDFKRALMDFGIESSDVDGYINLIEDLNESIEDVLDDSKTMEYIEISMSYEELSSKESEVLELLKTNNENDAVQFLSSQLKMKPHEISDVIAHLKFRIKMEGLE